MKIAFFDAKPYDKPHFDLLAAERGFAVSYYDTRLSTETASLAAGCEAVCVFVNDAVNAEVIDKLADGGTRVLALRCAGYNNVDVRHAYGRLHVVHVPAYSPYAVAEHAMAMLLTSVRRIHKAFIRTRDFNFSLNGLAGFDLHGKTAGVVGTGRIGRVFIDICRGFGMHVIAYDKFPVKDSGIEYVSFDELLERSDIISFHCPLNAESYHIFGAAAVEKCKKGVVVINTSRGALIDSEALEPVLAVIQAALGMDATKTREVFLTVALFAHGYASIIANNSLEYDEKQIVAHLERAWNGAVLAAKQEEPL